jgi:hypothetical protein
MKRNPSGADCALVPAKTNLINQTSASKHHDFLFRPVCFATGILCLDDGGVVCSCDALEVDALFLSLPKEKKLEEYRATRSRTGR